MNYLHLTLNTHPNYKIWPHSLHKSLNLQPNHTSGKFMKTRFNFRSLHEILAFFVLSMCHFWIFFFFGRLCIHFLMFGVADLCRVINIVYQLTSHCHLPPPLVLETSVNWKDIKLHCIIARLWRTPSDHYIL